MSFLSFAFLFALPLAAVPLMLHLFDRQRNVVIEWGAMQFLVEASRRRTSARRLQEWLLLLLRMLAIFCLVLALARPMLNSSWLNGNARVDAILVIDNSLSMMRQESNESLFQHAVNSANDQIDQMSIGDSARILLTSPYPNWLNASPVRISSDTRTLLREKIKAVQVTHGRGEMLGSLYQAVQAERVPGARLRRVIVFTDGQAADWRVTSSSSVESAMPKVTKSESGTNPEESRFADEREYRQLQDLIHASVTPIKLDLVLLGSRSARSNNLAVNHVECSRAIVGADQSVTLRAQVQNHGQILSNPCALRWNVGRDEIQHSEIPQLMPGSIHEVVWNHTPAEQGVHVISGQLDINDELTADNRESVIVDVVERLPILVVEASPDASEIQQDSFFLQAALGWVGGESAGDSGVYSPTIVTPDQLERLVLQEFRAIVIPNLTEINEVIAKKLQAFAADGGGIWIACGPRTDVERFNQRLFADGIGISPVPLERVVESESKSEKPKIDPVLTGHPANTALADTSRLDTGTIVVSRRFRFASSRLGSDVSTLLRVTDGEPFAVEKVVGRGRVIVQAAPLRLQWTELVRSQAFVVMVQDWLDYLTQPLATRHNLVAGEPIQLRLAGIEAQDATLRTPQLQEIELTPDPTANGLVFQSSRTIASGDYALEVGLTGDQIPFHVRRDVRESDLTALGETEINWVNRLSDAIPTSADNGATAAAASDPIWPLLLILLAGLILLELLLSGNMARQRFGSDPITEENDDLLEPVFNQPFVVTPMVDQNGIRRATPSPLRTES